MNVEEYLSRIRYVGKIHPSPDVLSALQEAHLLSVPFENLDIHTGKRITLEPATLFNKIVVMKRGGFCYELNGLFHWLLRELGFHVRLASGRVYDRHRGGYGPDFDHMLILAECAGHSWLVDVGFGDFSMRPLACTVHHPLTDRNGVFVIERHDDAYFKVSRFSLNDKVYLPQYLFSTGEQCLEDFSDMCLYHQTSPESHFTTGRICSIATATGRITLTDDRLILTESGVRTESVIRDEGEFGRALVQYFNIVQ